MAGVRPSSPCEPKSAAAAAAAAASPGQYTRHKAHCIRHHVPFQINKILVLLLLLLQQLDTRA
jgi:hypothetical protein